MIRSRAGQLQAAIAALGMAVGGSCPAAVPPPLRDLDEVKAVLAKAPRASTRGLRPLRVLLVANRKDHGTHEHDYPRWLERWKALLGGRSAGSPPVTMYGVTRGLPPGPKPGAAGVTVETASDWPSAAQLARADLVVAFMGTGGIWDDAKLRDLRTLMDRGAGFVALHSAVIAEKPHAQPLADLLGLAWEGGYTLFRHGPLDLSITASDNPITKGLPQRIHFEDETYWPLIGDPGRVTVLGTAEEPARETGKPAPQPMFWTNTVGKGRVFNSILGHYTWTFDDPYFRILVLRGMAWAAGESPYRFDPLVLSGARVTARKATAVGAPASPLPSVAPVAPEAPDAADPDLILWLDASEPATLTTTGDGHVAAWQSRSRHVVSRLSTEGSHQPVLAPQFAAGRSAVRFDGLDDVLRDTGFRQASAEWTVALVAAPRSNSGLFRSLVAANRPGLDDFQTGFNIDLGAGPTPAFNALNVEGIKGGGAANLRTESTPFGMPQVLVVTTGAGRSQLWVNGLEEEGRGASDTLTRMDEIRVGGRFYMGQERGYFDGDVAEVLLYRTQLSESRRAGLTAYLMKRYGVEARPPEIVRADPWDYLPLFDWSASRRPLTAIDEDVARAGREPRMRKDVEARLIEVAGDLGNALASRDYACRKLALIGSPAAVPVLSRLMREPGLSHIACFALARVPGPEAENGLLGAAFSGGVQARLEAIGALAARRCPSSSDGLARMLSDPEEGIRRAAVSALGSIGGPRAAGALLAEFSQGSSTWRETVAAALLQCAERTGDLASDIWSRLEKPDSPPVSRRAAIRADLLRRGAAGAGRLVDLLASADPRDRAMALILVRDAPGSAFTAAVAARLDHLAAPTRAQAITALADRGDRAALGAIRAAAAGGPSDARAAAVRALGRLGDVADVPTLIRLSVDSDRQIAAAAASALAFLSAPGVDQALLAAAGRGGVEERAGVITALGGRSHRSANPLLLQAVRGPEPAIRRAALGALALTAADSDIPALVELLARAADPAEAEAAEKTLAVVFRRAPEGERPASALAAALPTVPGRAKPGLLRVLSQKGGATALAAMRASLADPEPEVQAEALSLLADWETADAAPFLVEVVRTTNDPRRRTVALRGYIRMAGLPDVDPARRAEICREGLRLSRHDDERRLALAGLAAAPSVDTLSLAISYLENDALKDEAGLAAMAIGLRLLPERANSVAGAMEKVLARVSTEELRRQAADVLARAKQAGRP